MRWDRCCNMMGFGDGRCIYRGLLCLVEQAEAYMTWTTSSFFI